MLNNASSLGRAFGAAAVFLISATVSGQTVPNRWLFSTDLGSDLDLSDPITASVTGMDCGDVYYGSTPILFKDDDGLNECAWVGHPFTDAPQPSWDYVGKGIPGRGSDGGDYDDYFDLDVEEQLHLSKRDESGWPDAVTGPKSYYILSGGPPIPIHSCLDLWTRIFGYNLNYHLHPELEHYNGSGAFHSSWHKNKVYISFDDDNRYGWTNGPQNPWMYGTDCMCISIPTDCLPDNNVEIWQSNIYLKTAVPSSSGTDLTAIATEGDLGLGIEPTGTDVTRKYDDDVDALDWHPILTGDRRWPWEIYGIEAKWSGDPDEGAAFKHRYWSADHEAAMGTDPGSIYGTLDDGEIGTGNMANQWVVVTPEHFGLERGVDIDAFTWIALDSDETLNLFGYTIDSQWLNPETGQTETIKQYMLACLFSVDQNDPWTTPDESGGLSSSVIYCSDLEGHHVQVSGDFMFNIDAIALVPDLTSPPVITGQPSNWSGCPDATATVTVTATGPELRYQWQKNIDGTWTDVDNQTSATLTLHDVTSTEAGSYRCVITNADGSVNSDSITISLSAPPEISGPDPVEISVTHDTTNNMITLAAFDSDTQPQNLTWSQETAPNHGSIIFLGEMNVGTVINVLYTPMPGYFGPDTFTIQVTDDGGCTDTITVHVMVTELPPRITGWRSVRTQGTAGTFAMTLSETNINNESRRGGIRLIEIDLDAPVQATDGSVGTNDVGITDSASHSYTPSTVTLSSDAKTISIAFDANVLASAKLFTIDLSGKFRNSSMDGVTGDTDCQIRVLTGNINTDDTVSLLDLAAIRSNNGATLCDELAKYDVNCDGRINLIDAACARAFLSQTVP